MLNQRADPPGGRAISSITTRKAGRMSEHDETAQDGYEIGVNGTSFTVQQADVSYDEVVDLAYPNGRSDPNAMFKVDYEDAQHQPKDGELDESASVEVKHKGTEFSVIRSIRS
jgi:hypothetical protein